MPSAVWPDLALTDYARGGKGRGPARRVPTSRAGAQGQTGSRHPGGYWPGVGNIFPDGSCARSGAKGPGAPFSTGVGGQSRVGFCVTAIASVHARGVHAPQTLRPQLLPTAHQGYAARVPLTSGPWAMFPGPGAGTLAWPGAQEPGTMCSELLSQCPLPLRGQDAGNLGWAGGGEMATPGVFTPHGLHPGCVLGDTWHKKHYRGVPWLRMGD